MALSDLSIWYWRLYEEVLKKTVSIRCWGSKNSRCRGTVVMCCWGTVDMCCWGTMDMCCWGTVDMCCRGTLDMCCLGTVDMCCWGALKFDSSDSTKVPWALMIGSEQRTVLYNIRMYQKSQYFWRFLLSKKKFYEKPSKTGPNLLHVGTTLMNTD